jgi:hypothetical protein
MEVKNLLIEVIQYQLRYNKGQEKEAPAAKYNIGAFGATSEPKPVDAGNQEKAKKKNNKTNSPADGEQTNQVPVAPTEEIDPWKGADGQKSLNQAASILENGKVVGFVLQGKRFMFEDLYKMAEAAIGVLSEKSFAVQQLTTEPANTGDMAYFEKGNTFKDKRLVFLSKLTDAFSMYVSGLSVGTDGNGKLQNLIISDYKFGTPLDKLTTKDQIRYTKDQMKKLFPGPKPDVRQYGFRLYPDYAEQNK